MQPQLLPEEFDKWAARYDQVLPVSVCAAVLVFSGDL